MPPEDSVREFGKKETDSFWLPRPRLASLPKTLRLEILRQAFIAVSGTEKNLKRDHLARCDQLILGGKERGSYSLPEGVKFVRSGDDLLLRRNN